jgi:hypothetical protein
MTKTTRKVIAANEGFFLILPHATHRSGYEAHPIVGWLVECLTNTAFTVPVTLHGSHNGLTAVRSGSRRSATRSGRLAIWGASACPR